MAIPVTLNVGTNFDRRLVDGLARLNEKYAGGPRRVTETFGSLSGVNPIGTARPDFRLTGGTLDDLRVYVTDSRAAGIELNYTLNTSVVDPRMLKAHEGEITDFLGALQDVGVRRVIVAHPLVAQVVAALSTLPIELSTILQIRHPRQLDELVTRIGPKRIDKLCLDVFANRNARLLSDLGRAGRRLGIALEALTNEFCVYECPDRNACYDIHALNLSKDETRLFGHYPMGHCIRARITQPIEWLHARFILPQWMGIYADQFGVRSFKVSGRTHPTSYILRVTESYLSGTYTGNLLQLWADVENIGRLEDEYHVPRVCLDTGALDERFLRAYLDAPGMTVEQEQAHVERWYALAHGPTSLDERSGEP